MTKTRRQFSGLLKQTAESDSQEAPRIREAAGKRSRGHVQLSVLVPAEVRADLKMALPFDPAGRDLSELISDLVSTWLDSLPSGYQDVRPSRRQDVRLSRKRGGQ